MGSAKLAEPANRRNRPPRYSWISASPLPATRTTLRLTTCRTSAAPVAPAWEDRSVPYVLGAAGSSYQKQLCPADCRASPLWSVLNSSHSFSNLKFPVFSTCSVHNHHIEMIFFVASMNLERNARAACDFPQSGRYRLPRERGFRHIHRERAYLSGVTSTTNVGSIRSRCFCPVQRHRSARVAETRSSPMRGMR